MRTAMRYFPGGQPPRDPYYDVAQVCLGGHMVTITAWRHPSTTSPFAPRVAGRRPRSARTVRSPSKGSTRCLTAVRCSLGSQVPSAARTSATLAVPPIHGLPRLSRAPNCWLRNSTCFDQPDRHALALIPDLVHEGPRTAAATERFRRLVSKAGEAVPELMKDLLVNVAAESVRKALWGP